MAKFLKTRNKDYEIGSHIKQDVTYPNFAQIFPIKFYISKFHF